MIVSVGWLVGVGVGVGVCVCDSCLVNYFVSASHFFPSLVACFPLSFLLFGLSFDVFVSCCFFTFSICS